jgi:hypothetical protein
MTIYIDLHIRKIDYIIPYIVIHNTFTIKSNMNRLIYKNLFNKNRLIHKNIFTKNHFHSIVNSKYISEYTAIFIGSSLITIGIGSGTYYIWNLVTNKKKDNDVIFDHKN